MKHDAQRVPGGPERHEIPIAHNHAVTQSLQMEIIETLINSANHTCLRRCSAPF